MPQNPHLFTLQDTKRRDKITAQNWVRLLHDKVDLFVATKSHAINFTRDSNRFFTIILLFSLSSKFHFPSEIGIDMCFFCIRYWNIVSVVYAEIFIYNGLCYDVAGWMCLQERVGQRRKVFHKKKWKSLSRSFIMQHRAHKVTLYICMHMLASKHWNVCMRSAYCAYTTHIYKLIKPILTNAVQKS